MADEQVPTRRCPVGLTNDEVDVLVGDRRGEFDRWMDGQTMAICEGRRYDYSRREWVPDECANEPHGTIVFEGDVRRFLGGRTL